MNKERSIIRHIELPYYFANLLSGTVNGFGYDYVAQLSQSFGALRIERNKIFKIFNFSIIPTFAECNITTGSSADLQTINAPIMQIYGYQNENAGSIVNQWNASTYQYNGINDNPDLNIVTEEIRPYGYNSLLLRNFLSISGNSTLNPSMQYPISASNVVAQKSLFTLKKTSATTILDINKNEYYTDFYFNNVNYTKLVFAFTSGQLFMQNFNNIEANISTSGIISFDLAQYSDGK